MNTRLIVSLLTLGLLSTPAHAQRQPRVTPVVVAAVKLSPAARTVRLPGTVMAPRVSSLSVSVGGIVRELPLQLGDRVKAGDLVVQLDDGLMRSEIDQAKAALDEASLQSAERSRLLRIGRNLARRGMTSKDAVDARLAELRIAQATVRKLRAEVAGKQEVAARHRVVAPFAGVVANRYVEVGEWVSPGTGVIRVIADQDLQVDIALPQQYFSLAKGNAAVQLEFDAFPGEPVKGRVVTIAPSSDPLTRTFLMRVQPETDRLKLAAGMSVQASIRFLSDKTLPSIPRDALVRHADGRTTVWTVDTAADKPVASIRSVTPGDASGDSLYILDGVQAGEFVVITGNESLRPGQAVRITNDPS